MVRFNKLIDMKQMMKVKLVRVEHAIGYIYFSPFAG